MGFTVVVVVSKLRTGTQGWGRAGRRRRSKRRGWRRRRRCSSPVLNIVKLHGTNAVSMLAIVQGTGLVTEIRALPIEFGDWWQERRGGGRRSK